MGVIAAVVDDADHDALAAVGVIARRQLVGAGRRLLQPGGEGQLDRLGGLQAFDVTKFADELDPAQRHAARDDGRLVLGVLVPDCLGIADLAQGVPLRCAGGLCDDRDLAWRGGHGCLQHEATLLNARRALEAGVHGHIAFGDAEFGIGRSVGQFVLQVP